jgi:enoyl-CoA hydratase/carnithine racemase
MDYKEITFSQKESIGVLTLNTPDKINALSLKKFRKWPTSWKK